MSIKSFMRRKPRWFEIWGAFGLMIFAAVLAAILVSRWL